MFTRNHKKLNREEFRVKSGKRFHFMKNRKREKKPLIVHEALSLKREKTPIKK